MPCSYPRIMKRVLYRLGMDPDNPPGDFKPRLMLAITRLFSSFSFSPDVEASPTHKASAQKAAGTAASTPAVEDTPGARLKAHHIIGGLPGQDELAAVLAKGPALRKKLRKTKPLKEKPEEKESSKESSVPWEKYRMRKKSTGP